MGGACGRKELYFEHRRRYFENLKGAFDDKSKGHNGC
jgi:hypothetical protein